MLSPTIRQFDTRRVLTTGVVAALLTAALGLLAAGTLALNARIAVGAGGPGCLSAGPVCTFRGSSASTDFFSVSADECVFTDTFVNAFDSVTNPNGQATRVVYVFMSKFNGCTGETLLSASNFNPTTGIATFNGTFQIATKLDTATINGSAPMFDNSTGAQLFTSTVNVTLRGYGGTTTFIDSSHMRTVGFMMNTHFHGTSRAAEASGVVTDAAGANLAAVPTLYASLQNSSSGTVVLSH
jgi:hypothetical protein